MAFENLMAEYHFLTFKEKKMPKGLPGLYYDNVIEIDKFLSDPEKHCVLAEELGHYETTVGDITNLNCIKSRKQEAFARRWGYRKIVPLDKLIDCYDQRLLSLEDVCTHLEITPDFLEKTLESYKARYGLSISHKGYTISFDPLFIKKEFKGD